MNIPSIVDPNDMAVDEPDEFSVMAYISFYCHYETEKLRALFEQELASSRPSSSPSSPHSSAQTT